MARQSTRPAAIEAKALAAANKSEGMRMLLDADYSVAQIAHLMDAPYGFVYGVAKRAGKTETAASRRTTRTATSAKPTRTAKTAPAAKATRSTTRTTKATAAPVTASARVAARLAASKSGKAPQAKPGRPTAARRQANRKPRSARV